MKVQRNFSFHIGHRARRLGAEFMTAYLSAAMFFCLIFVPPAAGEELKKSGTVQIEQVQIAFIGSGNLGGGTLNFGGKTYSFTVGGLGIGGIGISRIEATGIVYGLKNAADFQGGYAQARYGIAIGSASTGELWLQNSKGVVMALKAKREGLALSLGGDAVYIKFN